MRNRRFTVTLLLTAGLWLPLQPTLPIMHCGEGKVYAGEMPEEESWKDEFDHIRSQVPMAMTLSIEELQGLVERCDSIRPSIEALEETPRKVYLKRLEKSKSLYLFVIENRKASIP